MFFSPFFSVFIFFICFHLFLQGLPVFFRFYLFLSVPYLFPSVFISFTCLYLYLYFHLFSVFLAVLICFADLARTAVVWLRLH